MPKFFKSVVRGKKYGVVYNGKLINFGDSNMSHFHDSTGLGLYTYKNHEDPIRRANYLKRARGITNKSGEYTYLDKNSANYYSVNYLW